MAGRYPETNNLAALPGADQDLGDQQARDQSNELRPDDLTEDQQKIWDRVCFELCKIRRMKPLHVDALREYCIITATMQEKRVFMAEPDTGWTYKVSGRNGTQLKTRPEVAHLNELWRQWNSLVAQFGLSPATEIRFNSRQLGLPFDDQWNDV